MLKRAGVSRKRIIEQYEKAVDRDSDDAQVWYSLKETLKTLGEKRLERIVDARICSKFPGIDPRTWTDKSGEWLYY